VLSNSFTLDWTRLTFELEQLREAARKYPYHDAGTHGVCRGSYGNGEANLR